MGYNTEQLGYLSALDGFRLLQAGLPLYIVSASPNNRAFPLEGAWRDDNGVVYFERACICLNPETAHKIGRVYNQRYILRLYPDPDGNSEVYLFRDTSLTRKVALAYGGGYTADGEYLFTAVPSDRSPFEDDYNDWLTADAELIPVR